MLFRSERLAGALRGALRDGRPPPSWFSEHSLPPLPERPSPSQEGRGGLNNATTAKKKRGTLPLPDPSLYEAGLRFLRNDGRDGEPSMTAQLRMPRTPDELRRLMAEAHRPGQHVALKHMGQVIRLFNTRSDDLVSAVDRKSTRLNSSHSGESRMPSSA